jgi:membrane-associated phospholipid phosphatase
MHDATRTGRNTLVDRRLIDRRRVVVAATALFTLACALVGWLAVRVPEGARLDEAALDGRQVVPWRAGLAGQRLLETISVASLAALTLACAAVAVARGRPRAALAAALLVAGANVTTQVAKHVVLGDHGAFPSGHATVAMSLALASLLVAPIGLRSLVALGGGAYAAAVGGSVVVAGWHRPSEAVAGFLVAGAWALLVLPVAEPRRGRVDGGRLAAVVALAATVAAFAAAVAWALRHDGGGLPTAALVASLGATVACALLVEGVVATTSAVVPCRAPVDRPTRR